MPGLPSPQAVVDEVKDETEEAGEETADKVADMVETFVDTTTDVAEAGVDEAAEEAAADVEEARRRGEGLREYADELQDVLREEATIINMIMESKNQACAAIVAMMEAGHIAKMKLLLTAAGGDSAGQSSGEEGNSAGQDEGRPVVVIAVQLMLTVSVVVTAILVAMTRRPRKIAAVTGSYERLLSSIRVGKGGLRPVQGPLASVLGVLQRLQLQPTGPTRQLALAQMSQALREMTLALREAGKPRARRGVAPRRRVDLRAVFGSLDRIELSLQQLLMFLQRQRSRTGQSRAQLLQRLQQFFKEARAGLPLAIAPLSPAFRQLSVAAGQKILFRK